ncbi:flagellin [Sphingomonas sp. AP4-R1]|uniref:flagellin n=1 Tax=Sphingomonas sp. AP4-R1 TaxID=2735134 RepID=UPI001493778B|nr:flagellin [Sphingomonas sp. AP4-R1]QJU57430.1 flagellin [Sphingomonas sp. AP4-R1]
MALSINTNVGAMAALQNLTATNNALNVSQSHINTGLKVGSTKDDSAAYGIAQKLRGDLGGLTAVGNSLSRAKSVLDVAVTGAEQISDIVNIMSSKAKEAADAIDQTSRDAINRDFTAYRDQIGTIVKSSDFNGTNLLKNAGGSLTALLTIQDGDTASTTWDPDSLTVDNQDFSYGGAVITVAETGVIDTQAAAQAMVDTLDATKTALATSVSTLGSASRRIDAQITFNSKLTDVITSGIGNLVDADMAKESAQLQALQVKQQLGVQALSIANQSPQTILSLFR